MYTIILDEGIVIRDSDQKIVSPSIDENDPDFLEYNSWANALGNSPLILESRG